MAFILHKQLSGMDETRYQGLHVLHQALLAVAEFTGKGEQMRSGLPVNMASDGSMGCAHPDRQGSVLWL